MNMRVPQFFGSRSLVDSGRSRGSNQMLRHISVIAAFLSVFFLPWQLWTLLTLAVSIVEPLAPLAIGLFADTLYYAPHGLFFPTFTLLGVGVTSIAFFVRSRLKTGSM